MPAGYASHMLCGTVSSTVNEKCSEGYPILSQAKSREGTLPSSPSPPIPPELTLLEGTAQDLLLPKPPPLITRLDFWQETPS